MLKELYCDTYTPKIDTPVDICFGAIASRNTDEPIIPDEITYYLNEYINLDVQKYLGLTFEEYLDTHSLIRKQYVTLLDKLLAAKQTAATDYAIEQEELLNGQN